MSKANTTQEEECKNRPQSYTQEQQQHDGEIEKERIAGTIASSSWDGTPVRADWDGVSALVRACWPEIGDAMERHLPALKTASFDMLQREYQHSMYTARDGGVEHEHFMSTQRLVDKGADDARACDVRAFLYHVVGLGRLFRGDGFTWTESGKRGVPEYLCKSRSSCSASCGVAQALAHWLLPELLCYSRAFGFLTHTTLTILQGRITAAAMAKVGRGVTMISQLGRCLFTVASVRPR